MRLRRTVRSGSKTNPSGKPEDGSGTATFATPEVAVTVKDKAFPSSTCTSEYVRALEPIVRARKEIVPRRNVPFCLETSSAGVSNETSANSAEPPEIVGLWIDRAGPPREVPKAIPVAESTAGLKFRV